MGQLPVCEIGTCGMLRNVAPWAEPTSRRTGHIPGAPVVFSSPVRLKVAGLATKVASTATKVARPATFGEAGYVFSYKP